MKYPPDKWSRDYSELLKLQASQLEQWSKVLRPEVYAELAAYCRDTNQPVAAEALDARASLTSYKAGGIHVCPVGFELHQVLFDRLRYEESIQYVLRSDMAVVAQAKQVVSKLNINTMNKKIIAQFAIIAAAFTALGEEFANLPAAGAAAAPSGPSKAGLKALAGRKDPKLVTKILSKVGADNTDEVEDSDLQKVWDKIEALDDVAGGGKSEGGEGTIDIEKLREVAQKLITDGKSSVIKKILSKFDSESISKLDEKHYAAVHAKLVAAAE